MTDEEHKEHGRKVLVVEDEYFLATDLVTRLEAAGATVIGPAPTVTESLLLVESRADIDTAVLDINLRGEQVYEVADALRIRGVPFIFVTGYDHAVLPPRFSQVPFYEKPVDMAALCSAVLGR